MANCLTHVLYPNVEYIITDERLRDVEPLTPATAGSAGIDLRACIEDELTIEPGQRILVGAGLKIHLDRTKYAGLILPRSGLGHKSGIVLGNLVGLIDSDYQGEIKMSIWNSGNHPFTIKPLDRLAQYVVVPVVHPLFKEVTEFHQSARAGAGFGSTGL